MKFDDDLPLSIESSKPQANVPRIIQSWVGTPTLHDLQATTRAIFNSQLLT